MKVIAPRVAAGGARSGPRRRRGRDGGRCGPSPDSRGGGRATLVADGAVALSAAGDSAVADADAVAVAVADSDADAAAVAAAVALVPLAGPRNATTSTVANHRRRRATGHEESPRRSPRARRSLRPRRRSRLRLGHPVGGQRRRVHRLVRRGRRFRPEGSVTGGGDGIVASPSSIGIVSSELALSISASCAAWNAMASAAAPSIHAPTVAGLASGTAASSAVAISRAVANRFAGSRSSPRSTSAIERRRRIGHERARPRHLALEDLSDEGRLARAFEESFPGQRLQRHTAVA